MNTYKHDIDIINITHEDGRYTIYFLEG
jgi:hypothetical protein